MKVTREKTENSQAYLTVEIDPAELEDSVERSFRRLVQVKRIPGFRPGKTPRSVFERHFGRQSLLEEAYELLVPEAYKKALAEQSIEAIASPQLEITQTEPLIFKAIVPLKPTVTLGDYNQVRVAPETPREVSDTDVDGVIDALRHQQATWEPAEREVQSGDMVSIDISSEIEGKPYIEQKNGQYHAKAGSEFPLPGFAEQLIGMKPGEEKEFTLKFAPEDARKEYAGKDGKFKVKLLNLKQEKLPELNDDFAKSASPENPTLAALRERVMTTLKQRAQTDAENAFHEKVMEAVTSQAQAEFPELLVTNEIHRLIDQRFRTREQFEAYMRAVNKTEEAIHQEMHDELQPLAVTRVKRGLILGKIAEAEKVAVADSEIDAETERMLASLGTEREKLEKTMKTPEARESISDRLLTDKTVERLLAIARGEAEQKKEESK
jgi:trigger factor